MDVIQESLDDLFTIIYEYPLWLQLLILLYVGEFFDHATLNKSASAVLSAPPSPHPSSSQATT